MISSFSKQNRILHEDLLFYFIIVTGDKIYDVLYMQLTCLRQLRI